MRRVHRIGRNDRRGEHAVTKREHGRDRFHGSGSAERVPDHRLGGAEGRRVGRTQLSDGPRLRAVVRGCARAVSVHVVDIVGRQSAHVERGSHRAKRTPPGGIRSGGVVRVRAEAIAPDHGENGDAARLRRSPPLEHDDAGPLAEVETAAARVRGAVQGVQRLEAGKAAEREVGERIDPSRDHDIRVPALDEFHAVGNGDRPRSACIRLHGSRSGVAELLRDVVRDRMERILAEEARVRTSQPLFEPLAVKGLTGACATQRCTERDAHALRCIVGRRETGTGDGLLGRIKRHGMASVDPTPPGSARHSGLPVGTPGSSPRVAR